VEGVEGGPRDEGGLVFDPQLFHRIEAVGKYDALAVAVSKRPRFR
jgi:hypothetical protein